MSVGKEVYPPSASGSCTVVLNGRLAGDPEFRAFGSDRGVVNFSIPVRHIEKDSEAEEGKKEVANFYRCAFYTQLENGQPNLGAAGIVYDRYKKGMFISVMGRLEPSPWSRDKDGETKSGIEFRVTVNQLLSGNLPPREESDEESPRRELATAGRAVRRTAPTRKATTEQIPWE